jgi:hypothetical protein
MKSSNQFEKNTDIYGATAKNNHNGCFLDVGKIPQIERF